ncbi:response regulator transcription factor [candidate division KSB1 bacterium]|nr:response regulator transcription factor [candidate division KSB1 bacterium]MBL7094641.1 response regulator transcription factor [candidate division KSB1 bacterium]
MGKRRILLVDKLDNSEGSLFTLMDNEGFNVTRVSDLDFVKEAALEEKPKAVVVNCDTFDSRIWDVCKNLKDDFDTRKSALVMLSSNGEESDIIRAIQTGADDYVVRPFSNRSVVARMRAVIGRNDRNESKKIKVKDIEIDLDEHKVIKSGKTIDLTYIQFKLLYLLASRRDSVFSRKEILEKVWGRKVYVTNRTVDVHIKRLREKLGEYKYPSQYIETIHGTGYRFL